LAPDADVLPVPGRPDDEDITAALGLTLTDEKSVAVEVGAPRPDSPDERLERMLRRAEIGGSGPAVHRFIARVRQLGLQVRPYKYSFTVTPPQTKAVALVAMAPDEQQETVNTWVSSWALSKYFSHLSSERIDTELGTIAGRFLTGREIDALADHLEVLLHSAAPRAPVV
jgi:hypothetical protein